MKLYVAPPNHSNSYVSPIPLLFLLLLLESRDNLQKNLKKQSICSNRLRQVLLSSFIFLHSFLYGWFFLVSVREVSNKSMYYGVLHPNTNITNFTGSASSSSSSASRRMLLGTSSSSSSSSTSSSHSLPTKDTPGWHTCEDYKNAGATKVNNKHQSFSEAYIYISGDKLVSLIISSPFTVTDSVNICF